MTRVCLAAVLVAAVAGPAAADCPPKVDAPVKVHVVRDAAGSRIVIDTPIDVCARRPAPQVAYLTAPLTIEYRWSDVQLELLSLIVKSVERAPFEGSR